MTTNKSENTEYISKEMKEYKNYYLNDLQYHVIATSNFEQKENLYEYSYTPTFRLFELECIFWSIP